MNPYVEGLRAPRSWLLPALVFGACLAVGIAIAKAPAVGAGVALAICAGALGLSVPGIGSRIFLGGLTFVLLGYAFMGRGFAYLGVPPVFIGEVVLAIGLLALILDSRRTAVFRTPLAWAMVLLLLWGAARTLPYISEYGIMSLRDAVIWGYAIVVFALVPPLLRDRTLERLPDLYRKLLPIYVCWVPIAVVIDTILRESVPNIPGSRVPFIDNKAGDLNVHLAGVAAFLLLGLDRYYGSRTNGRGLNLPRVLLWAVWLVGFAMAGALNRGGMLSVFVALMIVTLVRPLAVVKRMAMLAVVGFVIISSLLLSNLDIRMTDRRSLSVEQLTTNVTSIFSKSANEDGTRQWRLLWWADIIEYTVLGPYFWTGKGYGINLATSDGYQVMRDNSLRSPHNGHMTVLARSGVPGLLLWAIVQVGFMVMMIRTYFASRARGDDRLAAIAVWIVAYWAAFMVNGTFDVFLEGPQGGIWLWAVYGMGVAASLISRDKDAEGSGVTAPTVPPNALARG